MKTLPSSQDADQRLRILVEAIPRLALHQTVDDILETGLDLCRDLLGPGLVALALVSNGNELVPVAHLGLETRLRARLRIGPSITCSGRIPEQCTLYDRPETERLARLDVGDRWETVSLSAIGVDLRRAQVRLALLASRSAPDWSSESNLSVGSVLREHAPLLARYDRLLDEVQRSGVLTLASATVLSRLLLALVEAAA